MRDLETVVQQASTHVFIRIIVKVSLHHLNNIQISLQYYHEKSCEYCGQIPKESSICLFCGTIVCLKQQCCAEDDCFEAVRVS